MLRFRFRRRRRSNRHPRLRYWQVQVQNHPHTQIHLPRPALKGLLTVSPHARLERTRIFQRVTAS